MEKVLEEQPDNEDKHSFSNSFELQTQTETKEIGFYKGIYCSRSYYIFSTQNMLRIIFYRICNSNAFENFILFLICISSIKLAWDTYILELDNDSVEV